TEVRQHIEHCIRRGEPFDRQRLRYYRTAQRELHTGPPPAQSEDFPGFTELAALVIHAEIGEPNPTLPDPMRLYLPVREPVPREFFSNQQQVWLFLYPPGTLLGRDRPATVPNLLIGRVVMNNAATDAPVNERAASCQLQD